MAVNGSNPAQRLAERTLELVNVPSPSGSEQALAERVGSLMTGGLELVHGDGESVYARPPRSGRPLVVFAGHLDTVPAQENIPGGIEGGAVTGCGSSDMKSGLAVMIELARWVADEAPALEVDPAFLFFPREELPIEQSSMPGLFAAFHGESAHSARPWLGVNAIELAMNGLKPIFEAEPLDLEQGGLIFTEVLSVTGIEAGIAANVIPDRCVARVNYRYSPARTPAEAEARLRKLLAGAGDVELTSNSPPAHVPAASALLQRLRRAGDLALEPKQAWTPVAEFAARGLDAVNFGPGAPAYAHKADERVEVRQLERSFAVLRSFLSKEM